MPPRSFGYALFALFCVSPLGCGSGAGVAPARAPTEWPSASPTTPEANTSRQVSSEPELDCPPIPPDPEPLTCTPGDPPFAPLRPTRVIESNTRAIDLGPNHTCAAMNDGTVRCWGSGWYGQLGSGARTALLAPMPVDDLNEVRNVAVGAGHSCALKSDGSVWCWGGNDRGQLGDGTTRLRLVPTQVTGLGVAVEIVAGWGHTCARLGNGTVWCWGDNRRGQLGNGGPCGPDESIWGFGSGSQWGEECVWPPSASPVQVSGIDDATGLVAGAHYTCASRPSADVECWGRHGYTERDGPPDRSVPVAVAGSATLTGLTGEQGYACGASRGRDVLCWRVNTQNAGARMTPTAVPSPRRFTSYSTAGAASCFVMRNGSVQCYGNNFYGRLGDGTRDHRFSFSEVAGLSSVSQVAVSERHACARTRSGAVYCWGDNEGGQVGAGTITCPDPETMAESDGGEGDFDDAIEDGMCPELFLGPGSDLVPFGI